jgi:hypothetical protein
VTIALVAGALANKPLNGGAAWTRLSYALGLRKMGFTVYFVEQIDRGTCVDRAGEAASFDRSVNVAFFEQVVAAFGLSRSAFLVYEGGERVCGGTLAELCDVAHSADLLINIGGHLTLEQVKGGPRRKVYIDPDPGFTQLWPANGHFGPRLDGHDLHFTVGENIGSSGCRIPSGGVRWRPTRPPVVLDLWPVSDGSPDRFTTVGAWRGPYGPVVHDGVTFGLKAHEFRRFLDLPSRTEQRFEVALDIHPADRKDLDALRGKGWDVVDPMQVAGDPDAFRRYVQRSGAEFSVAQSIYVQTGSGWFSDRTTRYLASGKPALVQDTGFTRNYPVGDGLVAFGTIEDAAAGAARIAADYERHCRAARELAVTHFDSDVVLGRLLEEAGVSP